ncbi:hypothetical protein LCGC14_1058820 [marine sediment metagenome]|uniref:Uncharacterized protein n=1 Tax=marine sediment metagenome TaxID=412755 RepID=A0A0F9QSL9_9ZZZZ
MQTISLIPGATTAGDSITVPTGLPDIESVFSAEITRLPVALADHPAADITAGLGDHTAALIHGAIADHPAVDVLDAVADHSAALMQASLGNHTQADVADAVLDHAVHAHALEIELGGGGAPAEAFGASGGGVADLVSVSGQTIAGGAAAFGVQDYTTPAHAAGANPLVHAGIADVAHAAGANPVTHAVGGAPIAHIAGANVTHTGASPVVAATPTRETTRTISLDVNTLLGDALTLFYREVGEGVLAT